LGKAIDATWTERLAARALSKSVRAAARRLAKERKSRRSDYNERSEKAGASEMLKALIEKGLRQHRAGRLGEARKFYEEALRLQPRDPDALHLAGLVHLQTGEAERAVGLIQRAIEELPDNPGFHANLGQAYLALGRAAEARAAFLRAAALDPANPQFAVAAASALALQGEAARAEEALRAAVQAHPAYALGWFDLGHAVREQGRLEEAVELYRRAAELAPSFPDAPLALASALHRLGRFEEAERAYRRHLALAPDSVPGAASLASLLIDCGRCEEAVALCRRALARAPSVELHCMLGSALLFLGRVGAALAPLRAALAQQPENVRARWGCGLALLETGAVEEALGELRRALELDPDSPALRYGMAGVHLALGDWAAGWKEHLSRPARERFLEKYPPLEPLPRLPETLEGQTLLLLREQGLGDELFFLRFAAELRARGAEIVHRAHPKLAGILGRVAIFDRVISESEPLPAADRVLLIGDLPLALGCTQTPPPLALAPLGEQLEATRARLAQLGPPPYVGVTWRAGTAPERQGTIWLLSKSLAPERLAAALRKVPGTVLSLQRHPAPGETERFAAALGRPVHDLSAVNEDLEAMLALLALLDDYVGVSNTNMHLRAGVGQTARVLVPRPAEWRWMIAGEESPWFPGFRIYRQGTDGDWGPALARLKEDLLAKYGVRTR
jgi:tetratricopeptide (TPR) repeat protein